MEKVTIISRLKATTLSIILILFILAGVLFSVSIPSTAYAEDGMAIATDNPLEFSVEIKIRPLVNGNYETVDMSDVPATLDAWQDYVTGNVSTNNLAVILTMKNVPDSTIATYSYVSSATQVADITTDTELNWSSVATTSVSDDCKYAVIYLDSTATSNLYYYFKVNANSSIGGVTYDTCYDTVGYNVSLSADNIQSSYGITSISASYDNGDPYEMSTVEKDTIWSSKTINIKVVSASQNVNAFHYYRLTDATSVDSNAETIYGTDDWWLPAQQYDGYSIIALSDSYEGGIEFCATNADQTIIQEKKEEYFVKIDTATPIIDIKVTKADGTAYQASTDGFNNKDSDWSDSAVTYTITPNQACISGVTYKYKANETAEWVNMDSSTSNGVTVYTYVVSESVTGLQFRAVSNAGITATTEVYNANIDMQVPSFHIDAVDGLNATIVSGGYASDFIKFELILDSLQNSKVYYNYKIGEQDYQPIASVNGAYILEVHAPIVAETYTFQVKTQAGLSSEIAFETNVLSSEFSLSVPNFEYDTVNGWANETIAIDMYLPALLENDSTEYTLYYMVSGDASSAKEMRYTLAEEPVMWNGVLSKKYTAYLDECMSGLILRLYAVNKAGDDSTYYTTEQIFLDNLTPDIDIEAYISESSVQVGYEVWASGKVTVYIIMEESNISGLKCYNVVSGVMGKELTSTAELDGKTAFVYSTDKNGLNTYNFVVQSGSGLESEVSIDVGIDTSTIDSASYYAEANDVEYVSGTPIATDLTIEFDSTHNGHFTYYYYQYTESNGYTTDLSKFTAGEAGVSTLVIDPESITNGQLTVHYVFILVSDAVNADGERTITAPMELQDVMLDTRTFDIAYTSEASVSGTVDGWYKYYSFGFTSESDIINVSEMKFQMRLEDGIWVDIADAVSVAGDIATFVYSGEERHFGDLYMGTSYQGSIEFRALNTAGKASNVVGTSLQVKIDNIEADPFYGMDLLGGSRVEGSDSNTYNVYSTQKVPYINTLYSTDTLFQEMASIQYYYILKSLYAGGSVPSTADPAWNEVIGINFAMGEIGMDTTFYVYAKNVYGDASEVYTYTICVQSEAEFKGNITGGIYGTQEGLLENDWASEIEVRISSTSESDIFLWYSQGNRRDWILINANALTANENQQVIFYADASDANNYIGKTAVCLGNLQDTFYFKMTNLAGDEFAFDTGVVMRLESVAPQFDLAFSVGNESIDKNDLTEWQKDAVRIVISPVDVNQNPGGVIYYYFIQNASTAYSLIPGGGTSFTTDDLMPLYSGIGEMTITIRAVANADATQVVEDTITIKIDSEIPDFEITGTAIVTGSSTARVVNSGEWMQTETITLALFATAKSPSDVVYNYILKGAGSSSTAVWDISKSLNFNSICVVIVTATNSAGLTATHEFEVNMDNDAPIIYAGAIVNKYIEQADGTFKIDYDNPNTYYIDQMVTFEEANLKSATYNNFPLSNGKIIGTNSVDNTNTGTNELGQGGYVHITIEDMAGNIAELVFYMSVFPLDVNTISLSDDDMDDLKAYEQEFLNARETVSLSDSRAEYFEYHIERLYARISTLRKMVKDYQEFLETINARSNFDLMSDYENMWTYYNYFTTADTTILYPTWLQELITEGEYGDYFNKLQTELAKLEALMKTVKAVQQQAIMLPAMNDVKETDYESIMRVFNAYESMTTDQRAVFTSTLYTKLIEVKRLVELLLLQDETTGISIAGKDLASGVAISVETYANTTELVNNAQLSILENYVDGTARAIISVSKISLSGHGSQYDTGDITVTLPIPTDFQIYTKFAVYALSADGTISVMEDCMINADGKSVSFSADTLGTYVLATNANLKYRDVNEKIYGVIGGIEIDGTLLTYITISAVALFVLLAILMIIVGIKNHWFLRTYNKAYKNSRRKRNTVRVPKGNPAPLRNPAAPEEIMEYDRKVYTNKEKDM